MNEGRENNYLFQESFIEKDIFLGILFIWEIVIKLGKCWVCGRLSFVFEIMKKNLFFNSVFIL